jgi:hypothetical protein
MTAPASSSVSSAHLDVVPERPQRRRLVRRIRLSTLLLLMVVVALLVGLYAQKRRQAQLLAALSVYRNLPGEGIYNALGQPIALTYVDGAPLDVVLKKIKAQTTKNPKIPKLPAGIPIYVDPLGLQEAGRSMNSQVKRPPSADTLTLGEYLAHVLNSLGLAYQVKDGYLMITSKESIDVPLGEQGKDLYIQYRDLLE